MKGQLSDEEVHQKMDEALVLLLRDDLYLLKKDVNERAISHRLALYLQQVFEGWHVDCEYNRNHDIPKILELAQMMQRRPEGMIDAHDTEARTVFPDIIIHHRGTDENLLVIEMKKTTSSVPNDFDLCKLKAFKRRLGYRHAVFLKLRTGCENCGVESLSWR